MADRVVEMTVEMFREPRKMVQEISGLGLRHAGGPRMRQEGQVDVNGLR